MKTFLKSVGFAWTGVRFFFTYESNGRIQGLVALMVVAAGLFTGLTNTEWCIILLSIALVIGLEMMNTCLERVCNMTTTDFHPMIKIIKDVSAGAVLLATITAVVIGLLIFVPYLKSYWFQ